MTANASVNRSEGWLTLPEDNFIEAKQWLITGIALQEPLRLLAAGP
jgi:hypothetical protein